MAKLTVKELLELKGVRQITFVQVAQAEEAIAAATAASASSKSSQRMPSAIRYAMAHCSASTTNFAIEQCMPASFQPAECNAGHMWLSLWKLARSSNVGQRRLFSRSTMKGAPVIAEGMVPLELVRAPDEWKLPDLGKIDIRLFKNKSLSPLQLELASKLESAFSASIKLNQ